MSRVKAFKRVRNQQRQHESHTPPKQQMPRQSLPIETQVNMLFAGIGRLAEHLSEIELMVEFTMRNIVLERKLQGGLILEGGRAQVERLSMLQFYERNRDAFAQQLQKERDEAIRTGLAASGSAGGSADPNAPPRNGDSTRHDEREANDVLDRVRSIDGGANPDTGTGLDIKH